MHRITVETVIPLSVGSAKCVCIKEMKGAHNTENETVRANI